MAPTDVMITVFPDEKLNVSKLARQKGVTRTVGWQLFEAQCLCAHKWMNLLLTRGPRIDICEKCGTANIDDGSPEP